MSTQSDDAASQKNFQIIPFKYMCTVSSNTGGTFNACAVYGISWRNCMFFNAYTLTTI